MGFLQKLSPLYEFLAHTAKNDFDIIFWQVSTALCCLRRRNSYQENVHPKCATTAIHPPIQLSAADLYMCKPVDFGLHMSQIIESSRMKARTMVVAAIQAASSLFKEAQNPDGFEEVLDYVTSQLSAQDFLLSADSVAVNSESQDQVDVSCSNCPGKNHGLNLNSINSFDKSNEKIPSELITNCIATMLMIQNCTKRQCPPSEVAKIIDSAMKSLRPLCSQNLPIYNEIQDCMGMIRNQILGLVPTTVEELAPL
ncbi:hypothetical protein SAY86_015329 [Trapa natans]|uniref:Uncharacterized protein n=1 Tax=Trapa natans TaxID=22666 RepID=A0AAN7KLX2_TRANT|nr:hypothetical protein SAY86_015329 [Trapa natans]